MRSSPTQQPKRCSGGAANGRPLNAVKRSEVQGDGGLLADPTV